MEVRLINGERIYQLFAFDKIKMKYELKFISTDSYLIEEASRGLDTTIYNGFMIKCIRKTFYKIVDG